MFRNVDEIKVHFSGVQKKMSDSTIMPFVEQAAIRYLVPYIGAGFYESLRAAHVGGVPTADQALAIERVQRTLAYYTFLDALPFLSMAIGDLGAHETSTQNSMPARQWVYNNLEAACAANADTFLESLLSFLEENAAKYTLWSGSAQYSESKELFFYNAGELAKYLNMASGHIAYITLRPYIRRAEDLHITPLLGEALTAQIKTAKAAKTMNADQKQLAEKVYKALAQLSLAEAIAEAGLLLSGFQISSGRIRIVNGNEKLKETLAASPMQLQALKSNCEKLGAQYMADLKRYLDNNATVHAAYQSSAYYQGESQIRRTYQAPDNSGSTSFRV